MEFIIGAVVIFFAFIIIGSIYVEIKENEAKDKYDAQHGAGAYKRMKNQKEWERSRYK